MACGESRYKQWITLFDHFDDDEYDGDFGENDEETPRVQFLFSIEEDITQSQPLESKPLKPSQPVAQ